MFKKIEMEAKNSHYMQLGLSVCEIIYLIPIRTSRNRWSGGFQTSEGETVGVLLGLVGRV